MKLYLRLLSHLRPYFRLLASTVVVTILFAALEGASIGMISPLTKPLMEKVERDGATSGAAQEAEEGSLIPELPTVGGVDLAGQGWLRQTVAWFERFLFPEDPMVALMRVSTLILIVFLLKGVVVYVQRVLIAMIEHAVMRDLRNALFAQYTRLSLGFFHRKRHGELISRVTNDTNLVRAALVAVLFWGLRDTLLIAVCLFWVFWVSWRLALVSLAVIPLTAVLVAFLGRNLRRTSRATQERVADLTAVLGEALGGMRVMKAFAMERFENDRFRAASQGVYRAFVKLQRYEAISSPSSEMLGVIAAVVVVFYSGHLIVVEGSLTADRFFLFMLAMVSMIRPLKKLAGINAELQQGLAATQRIYEILDLEPTVSDRPGARPVDAFGDAIRFEGVDFAYEPPQLVLSGIDLTIAAGEVVALIGPSGAGKSTLADMLPRFHDPSAGRITLDGVDLRDLELARLRRLIGLVTQDVILFHDTVRKNIAYGDSSVSLAAVEAAARAAHAHQFITELSDGYDTVIGDRGVRLSGGQRQRLAIARAILKNPPILIFDEATSALDNESERLVQQAISRLLEGRTVLVIAHRLSTIRAADRIVVIDGGRLVEEGDHDQLLAANGVYRRLYEFEHRDHPSPVELGASDGSVR
jgi:subfamily B ATP-binding cassette protein MsbA